MGISEYLSTFDKQSIYFRMTVCIRMHANLQVWSPPIEYVSVWLLTLWFTPLSKQVVSHTYLLNLTCFLALFPSLLCEPPFVALALPIISYQLAFLIHSAINIVLHSQIYHNFTAELSCKFFAAHDFPSLQSCLSNRIQGLNLYLSHFLNPLRCVAPGASLRNFLDMLNTFVVSSTAGKLGAEFPNGIGQKKIVNPYRFPNGMIPKTSINHRV